jgi:hypothetical protein
VECLPGIHKALQSSSSIKNNNNNIQKPKQNKKEEFTSFQVISHVVSGIESWSPFNFFQISVPVSYEQS